MAGVGAVRVVRRCARFVAGVMQCGLRRLLLHVSAGGREVTLELRLLRRLGLLKDVLVVLLFSYERIARFCRLLRLLQHRSFLRFGS